ncbi:pseudouridine synthase [Shewanella litorisediminis]|uniref:Pseudouridine synthase n=1 Tax=Shewanella litorisediminis TaxID=1173586 RepID=A0ABX7G1L4_9GAMM|nr:RNA pseudouridine synthase [Shewanella litorisediminis]MCL2920026.1 RNA pseudouridine synthase [Shewanella litorisediminis]QRH01174.1 pseudouridine synthase [Shewanella litorisediminis]
MSDSDLTKGTRLCKYLAEAGVASRRGASRLIEAGRVCIDGQPAAHSDRVFGSSQVTLDGEPLYPAQAKTYFLYHKPVGIDCRLRPDDPYSLIHHLPADLRLFPAGRLDKDSRGLLLLTNDGELTQRLMHPDFHHEKGYLITLNKAPKPGDIAAIAAGLDYGEGPTRPCRIAVATDNSHSTEDSSTHRVRMWLTQGKKRQIRRLWRARGYLVVDLLRESIQSLTLGELGEGQIRALNETERLTLLAALGQK